MRVEAEGVEVLLQCVDVDGSGHTCRRRWPVQRTKGGVAANSRHTNLALTSSSASWISHIVEICLPPAARISGNATSARTGSRAPPKPLPKSRSGYRNQC